MVSFSIHGSCVSRDIFRIASIYYQNNFKLVNYFARQSILSSVSDPISVNYSEINAKNVFLTNCIYYDFSKSLFNELKCECGKYFILDLGEERYPLGKIDTRYFTNSNDFLESDLKKILSYNLIRKNKITWENTKKMIDLYCEKIKEIYPIKNIIIIEVYFSKEYVNRNFNVMKFQIDDNNYYNYNNLNCDLKRMYKYLKFRLKGAKFIRFKNTSRAFEMHKWGLMGLHFEDKEYLYVFREIIKYLNLNMNEEITLIKKEHINEDNSYITTKVLDDNMVEIKVNEIVGYKYKIFIDGIAYTNFRLNYESTIKILWEKSLYNIKIIYLSYNKELRIEKEITVKI